MSPDLKRLCEAAWKAETDGGYLDHQFGERSADDGCEADRARHEAIVRAVLTELREVRDATCVAGGLAYEESAFNSGPDETVFDGARKSFTAMLDHILAGPATV